MSSMDASLHADAPQFATPTAENVAALAVGLAPSYSHVMLPATGFGKNIAPRIAALLDVAQVSDIIAVESADTFVRPIYAGNAFATVQAKDAKKVITVRTTGFDAAAATGGSGAVETVTAPPDSGRVKVLGQELTKSDRPELTSARVIISGGRGLQDPANFKLIDELAAAIGKAAVGATRAIVDAGWVPYSYQVGQTGKTVKPEVYIAVGISGATQHQVGMKEAKRIIAINKDPDAPIFKMADLGIVGDALKIVPALTEEIKSRKG